MNPLNPSSLKQQVPRGMATLPEVTLGLAQWSLCVGKDNGGGRQGQPYKAEPGGSVIIRTVGR